jgi:hypothetical protein
MSEPPGAGPAADFARPEVAGRSGLLTGLVGAAEGRIRRGLALEVEPPVEANRDEVPT